MSDIKELRFEDRFKNTHYFIAFGFDNLICVPSEPGPYALLSSNLYHEDIASHTVLYAGESSDCRNRCYKHAQDRERFQRYPSLVLLAKDWRGNPVVRADRRRYEGLLKYWFNPIYDKEARHERARTRGRETCPNNHLINVDMSAGTIKYGGIEVVDFSSGPQPYQITTCSTSSRLISSCRRS